MTDELFAIEETLSPKEAWKRKHGIRLYHNPEMKTPFQAIHEMHEVGMSEEEALAKLAARMEIKLWNQP